MREKERIRLLIRKRCQFDRIEKPHKIYYLGSDTIIRHRTNAAALFYNDKKLYMQNKLDYVNQ